MSRRCHTARSLFDPETLDPGCLEEGTTAQLLNRYSPLLFPAWLVRGWRGEGRRGRKAWSALVLAGLLLLRWTEEGMSRRASCRQAKRNTSWRAALRLPVGGQTPDERTVRDFERFMKGRSPDSGLRRYEMLHAHIIHICQKQDIVNEAAVWVQDSTPMYCYGATLDTIRLLGDGLRALGLRWSRVTGESLAELSKRWELPLLTGKSTKGSFRIDWRDQDARAKVVTHLAEAVLRVVSDVRGHLSEVRQNKHKSLIRKCRALLKVVKDDLGVDDKGRYVIERKVTRGRHVSLTDPQARNGTKSKSNKFKGFKLHVLGDVVSGLIASIAVTPGSTHDGTPSPRLVKRAKELFEDIQVVLGDTAYGGAELRRRVREESGVNLVSPPPANTRRTDKLSKNDFEIDFEVLEATCPNGQRTRTTGLSQGKSGQTRRWFHWEGEQCAGCPLAERCTERRRGGAHRILLSPEEEEIRRSRKEWADPELRQAYRVRAQGERLVHKMTRHGGRKARQWGLDAARQQAYSIAMVNNLLVLAKALAAFEQGGGSQELAA